MDSPIVRRAFEYWSSRSARDRMPTRADIDPVDIPRLLANLAILDVREGDNDFEFRLAGERVAEACVADLKGRRLVELAGLRPDLKAWLDGARTAARSGAPHFFEIELDGKARRLEVGFLPMSAADDSERVGHLLVVAAITTT